MFKKTLFTLLLITISVLQVNAQNEKLLEWAEKGKVEKENYYTEIPFRYIDGYIFIDIIQNGNKYNFLFDTGAEATVIDKAIIDEFVYQPFSESTLGGPLVKTQEVKNIILSSIQIGELQFSEIGAIGIDLEFGEEKFCDDIHGIIGSNLMKKSKWQIDYKNQVIKISDDLSNFNLGTPKFVFETKLTSKGFGTETIDISINGTTMPFKIDTGNGRCKIVANPKYYKKVIRKSDAVEYGFPKSDKDYYLIPDKLLIGGVEFSGQIVSLENEVGNTQLLGNKFYENFIVTIDWANHQLYLEPQRELKQDELFEFPLKFKANYKSNKIEIFSGVRKFLKANKIKEGSFVSKVNKINILDFSEKDFCEFWNIQWDEMMREKTIYITIVNGGKEKEIVLTKGNLIY